MYHFPFPLRSAFLALPLEGEAKRRFHALQEVLRPWESILRFQNPATPHLTIYFWREMMQIEYDEAKVVAKTIADRTSPFTVETTGMELFSDRRGDRIMYLSVQFSPELATLRKLCPWPNAAGHPFQPHITIARIDHPDRFTVFKKKVLRAVEKTDFAITFDRLRIYAEIEGKKQTALGDFVFGK